jgi:hypothetical protein
MKNLLENIIKSVLFEQRTVGKIRSLSASDLQAARKTGAIWAYAVLVKGTDNTEDILNLVEAATLASTGEDTESRVAIGKNGKFADGNYLYVVGMPADKNRQIVLVRIFDRLQEPKTDVKSDIEISTYANHRIGRSSMITETVYNKMVAAYNNSGTTNYTPIEPMVIKTPVEKIKDLINPEPEASTTTTTSTADISSKTVDDSENEIKTIVYPYNWTATNGTYTVYTMSATDPYVYVKANKWYYLLKTDFESNYTDPSKIDTLVKLLNTAGIKKVEATFKKSNANNTDTETKPELPSNKKLVFNRKKGTVVPTFYYNSKTKKYTAGPKWSVEGNEKLKYITKSSDGKMWYVDLAGTKTWIDPKYLTYK